MQSKLSRRIIAQTIAEKLAAQPSRRSHWLKVLAAYLVEQKQVDELDLFVQDVAHAYFGITGELLADITSARPLSDAIRTELQRYLKAATGAERVIVTEHVEADLLGGLVARTPDGTLDTSVRTQLKRLTAIK